MHALALSLLLACGNKAQDTAATDPSADTGDPSDTATPNDSADSGDTSDTRDTSDTGDTSDTSDTDAAALEPGFFESLTLRQGCGDLQVAASNGDDTLALHVRVSGIVEQAYDAGGSLSWEWSFPIVGDAMMPPEVWVEQGSWLTSVFCNDVIEHPPVVTRSWRMVQGTLYVTVTPTGTRTDWDMPAVAEVGIAYGAFVPSDDPSATPVQAGDILISTGVGWFPG